MDAADDLARHSTKARHRSRVLSASLVVALMSLAAALAAPRIGTAVARSRARATADDLRAFAAAFQAYAREHGDWPEGDGTPGRLPAGVERYLHQGNWSRATPIGGHYTWDPDSLHRGSRYRAAIVITSTPDSAVTRDSRVLLELDRLLDDGALNTGQLVLGYRHYPVYLLEH